MEEPRDPQATPGAEPDAWRDGPRWTEPAADPWADSPAWSDGSPGPTPVADTDAPARAADAMSTRDDAPAACSWCGTPATPEARTCSSCGAALAQREQIGDLVIPGLTAVDPALQDYANRPLHLSGPSPSHGVASGAIAAAAVGGPAGLALIGGVAAVAAVEFLGAGRTGPDGQPIGEVDQASGAALQAIAKLERGEALPAVDETTPGPELEAQAAGHSPATMEDTADGGD